jgi:hypothetical protein
MVLEVEEDNLEKVAAEILERGKEQTNKTSSRSYQRALPWLLSNITSHEEIHSSGL